MLIRQGPCSRKQSNANVHGRGARQFLEDLVAAPSPVDWEDLKLALGLLLQKASGDTWRDLPRRGDPKGGFFMGVSRM